MAIDTSLFINIISQLKDKGIKDTEKGLKGLSGRTTALNKSLGVLARRVAVFETLRRSFKGFIEDEAAARRLNTTLTNLGLSFSALGVEQYLDTLEKATAVNNDQLRPSFETLARVTGDFAQTQGLLNTALDVAAGTSQSVTTVSKALARAYAGNTASLSRLNAGLSKATLATGNFALIQERLNNTFGGQAAAQADTYLGKVEKLKIAFQDAGDAVGKGLVDSLEQLNGGSVQGAINFIVGAGELIGKVFGAAARQVAFVKEIFTRDDFFGAESQLELFEKFRKIDDPARIRASARERRKALEEENRAAQKIARTRAKDAAAQKKAAAEAKKAEEDKLKLQKAGELFDDERISIAAALRNESLDRNEILRLELKKALINENADRAERLADQLKDSQKELAALAAYRLANPFQEWEDSLARIRAGMASVGVPVAPLSQQGTVSGQAPDVPSLVPTIPSIPSQTVTQEDLFDAFGGRAGFGGATNININVSGTGDLSDETKKKIVDTIIDYSSIGYSTSGWYRTTGNVAV
jgi:hypothetical protein